MTSHDEPALVASARNSGVGVYPVTPLFADLHAPTQPRAAGLILGYASLSCEQIQQGILTLASVIGETGLR
jgi:GntR family transcriptional regulator/MocR family aminotransferase